MRNEVGIVLMLGLAGAAVVAATLRTSAPAAVGGGAPPQDPWPSAKAWPDPGSLGVLAAAGWWGPGITIPPQMSTDEPAFKFPPAPPRA
jgi:hypothetical protein